MSNDFINEELKVTSDLNFELENFTKTLYKEARPDLVHDSVAALGTIKTLLQNLGIYLRQGMPNNTGSIEHLKQQLNLAKERREVVLGSLLNPSLAKTTATSLIGGSIAAAQRILKRAEENL